MIGLLKEGDFIDIQKAEYPLVFYRGKDYNFIKKLSKKLGNSFGCVNE